MAILDKLLGRNTMSETLTKIVVDCSTGVVEELPLTAEEIAQREADAAAFAEQKAAEEAEAAAKEAAKSELLAKLGITADEAKLLLS
jgi:tagatose-1,6-bisphosphate aldolase non-catalytic subunit AgaZ/GatZ